MDTSLILSRSRNSSATDTFSSCIWRKVGRWWYLRYMRFWLSTSSSAISRSPSLRSVCRFPMRLFTHLRCSLHQRVNVFCCIFFHGASSARSFSVTGILEAGSALRAASCRGLALGGPRAEGAKTKAEGERDSNSLLPERRPGLLCGSLPLAARGGWPRACALSRPAPLKPSPVPTRPREFPEHSRPLPPQRALLPLSSKVCSKVALCAHRLEERKLGERYLAT